MNYDVTKLDKTGAKLLHKLIKAIAKEHFHITLHCDRNMNYLWYMYYKGQKKDTYRPFMLAFELNLLIALGLLSNEEKESLAKMIISSDVDNFYIGLLAIDDLRKQRIKIHGDWTKVDPNTQLPLVSKEFLETANNYPVTIIKNYSLDRL
jgi:hypothetical protein